MLNNVVQTFNSLINTGARNLATTIVIFLSLLAIIDIAIAYIFEYDDNISAVIKVFINRLINLAFLLAITLNFTKILDEIAKGIFAIGYLFWPENGGTKLPDFDKMFENLYKTVIEINREAKKVQNNMGQSMFFMIAAVIACIAIFFLVKEVLIAFIEFKVTLVIGMILIPLNMLKITKDMGSKLFTTALNKGMKLLCSIAVMGIVLKALQSYEFVAGDGEARMGAAISYICLLGICAFLAVESGELANAVMGGGVMSSPSKLGNAVVGGIGVAGTAALAIATGGTSVLTGLGQGLNAIKQGQSVTEALKQGYKGFKANQELMDKTRLGKATKTVSDSIKGIIDFSTGRRPLRDLPKAAYKGASEGIKGQLKHDSEENNRAYHEFMSNDDKSEKVSDYLKEEQHKEAENELAKQFKEGKLSFDPSKLNKAEKMTNSAYRSAYKKAFNSESVKKAAYQNAEARAKYAEKRGDRQKTFYEAMEQAQYMNKEWKHGYYSDENFEKWQKTVQEEMNKENDKNSETGKNSFK